MKFANRASSSQWSFRPCPTVLLLMIAATSAFAQTRAPVPPADKQKEIAKLLEQTYNLAKLDSAAKKQDAVKRLLDASRNASFEAEERYVVLTTLIKRATETGDAASWLEAVNTLVNGFEVDAQKEKTRLLTEFLSASKSGLQMKPAVEEAIAMSRAAAQQNRYADATSLLGAAETAVLRVTGASNLKPLVAEERQAIAAQEKDWKAIQAANAKLTTNPDDPAANFTVGRWHVIQSGDWKTALPFLTKASDAKWKAAAQLERTEPTDATAQVAIGDAWYDIAQSESGVAKTAVLARAGRWYEGAQPNLTSALKKQLVAKRLEEIAPSSTPVALKPSIPAVPSPSPSVSQPLRSTKPGEWIDLLEWAEGVDWASRGINWNDQIEGKPTRDGIRLKYAPHVRFPLNAVIDGNYEMEVEFNRNNGVEAIAVYFPVGIHTMRLLLGADTSTVSHVSYVDGKEFGQQRPAPISNDQPHRVVIRVRQDDDKAAFNIDWDNVNDYIKWEGAHTALKNDDQSAWNTNMIQRPWIGGWNSNVLFQKVRVRMLSGTIQRDVITDAERKQDLKNGFVRLVGEEARATKVGFGKFTVNQLPLELTEPGQIENTWPRITRDFKVCDDFYSAHASSRIKCAIPKGAKSFSGIGYNDQGSRSKYAVWIDGKPVYDSGTTGIVVVKVDIPAKSSVLELVTEKAGSSGSGTTYWCYPRFHSVIAEKVKDKMLDGDSGPLKFTVASGTAGYGGVGHNEPIPWVQSIPINFRDALPCDEFLFAHASSTVSYQVPEEMTRFTAIAYNVFSHSANYEVWADAKRIYESPRVGILPIDVKLPPGTKTIELKINDMDGARGDHSMWCYPRLHRK